MSEWLERIVSNHFSSVEQESLLARAEQAEAAVQRVRELHHLTVDTVDCGEGGVEDVEHCAECGYIYVDAEPCPTMRALGGAE